MRKLYCLLICCLAICGPVFADNDDAAAGALEKTCKITRNQAQIIAQKAVAGTVLDTDIDRSVEGTVYWSVDIRTAKGTEKEVNINAQSGAVISIEIDND